MPMVVCLFIALFVGTNAFAKDCKQVLDRKSIKVNWTGYKFTEKEGVTGEFEKVKVKSSMEGPDIPSIVNGMKFNINGRKFDAGNLARNINLGRHFFKKFADKAKIKGEVKEMSKPGELTLALTVNGVTRDVPMAYKIEGSKFEATGMIEMLDFQLSDALKSISKACYDLHKGKDGVSKTWSTVDLKASANFKEKCS